MFTQVVDMFIIWGDLLLMTDTAFVLFTNVVHATKIVNLVYKKDRIQEIVKEADLALRDASSEEEKKIVKRLVLLQVFLGSCYIYYANIK